MKRPITKWWITSFGLLFILMMTTVITVALFKVGQEISPVTNIFTTTSVAALTQVESLLKQFSPAKKNTNEVVIRANGILTTSYGFFTKYTRPCREKTLIGKEVKIQPGFFAPIMVIVLFSIFYQMSRTSMESDCDSY